MWGQPLDPTRDDNHDKESVAGEQKMRNLWAGTLRVHPRKQRSKRARRCCNTFMCCLDTSPHLPPHTTRFLLTHKTPPHPHFRPHKRARN